MKTSNNEDVLSKYLEKFKNKIKDIQNETLEECYIELLPTIEEDTFENTRVNIINSLMGYNTSLNKYDWVSIRKQILIENKDEIIKDLNTDLLEENKKLKEELENYGCC